MIGLFGLELTSSTGAKLRLTPTRASSAAVARAALYARLGSSFRPTSAAAGKWVNGLARR